ncbi:MAG TPA: hypothetical protein VGR57_13945 [Ktedonobacterales bacterium]|nr:hypothetical protein [Ktedonobacterales bacterium]
MRPTRTSLAILSALTSLIVVTAFTLAPALTARPAHAAPALTGTSQRATATLIAHYQRDEGAVAAATPAELQVADADQLPALRPAGGRLKAAGATVGSLRAAHAASAPTGQGSANLTATFAGLRSAASICPPVGCNPPDMGLAVSPQWVVQGVNTSWAVYDTHGNLQPGWPKTFFDFAGVADHGACDGGVPFMSDPRALYDPGTGRFFAAALEVEGAFGVNNCPFLSIYWIAVSATSDPNGVWNIYAFDMTLGTTNGADFTMVGFDSIGLYFSANMFTQDGSAYSYAEVFGVNKHQMEANLDVTAPGYFNLLVNGPFGSYVADTVQPAQTEGQALSNSGEAFVDTLNGFDPATGAGCTSPTDACQGLAVWTMHPGQNGPASLGFSFVPTKPYYVPPPADQTTCKQCIDSSDLRISATPVERDGALYAGWETGVDNGTQIVAGIEWAQLDTRGPGATGVANDYYFIAGGDDAVVYPALMPDNSGALFMVFDHMSATVNPEVRLTVRQPGGDFQANGTLIKAGEGPYRPTRCGHNIPVCRWGDYSATSYDGVAGDHVWFAGQFTIPVPAFSRNWGTWIGEI